MKKMIFFAIAAFLLAPIVAPVHVHGEVIIPTPPEQSDDIITMQVQSLIHVSNITVKTYGGVVYLTGTVNSESTKAYIGSAAQSVQGVKKVFNNIIVTSS